MATVTRREFGTAALAAALLAAAGRAGAAAADDPLWFVDPDLRPAAREVAAMTGRFPPLTDATLAAQRAAMAGFARPRLAAVPVATQRVAVRGGPDVVVHVVNARGGAARPGILHLHGGGYVSGSAAGSVRDVQDLAAALDACVVTVDYRLAPETRFAGSVADNYAALRWFHAHAADLGVDPARIAVMGESAGGGHAALLAIAARDRGEVPIAFQCLVYPMLDDRTGSTVAVPAPIGTLVWTAASNRYGWRSFLGVEPGSAAVPAAGVPARVASVAGLPPAFIGVGAIDLFVAEDIAYAARLIAAGIATELLVVPGAFHGFDGIAAATAPASAFTAAKLAALRRGRATA